MSNYESNNCSECAYAQKHSGKIWCKFLDFAVKPNQVCDYYLDTYNAPLYESLAESNSRSKIALNYIITDIIGYSLSAILIIIAGIITIGVLTS